MIRTPHLGQTLAACFDTAKDVPDQSLVLMRGHGYTTLARGIEECIFRAIYARENAVAQTAAIGLTAAYQGKSDMGAEIQYLQEDEVRDASQIAMHSWKRAWSLWVREVEVASLYTYTRANK